METPEELKSNVYVLVVTCALLHKNSNGILETLVLKRSEKEAEGPGLWTIPGGKVDRIDWGEPIPMKNGKMYFKSILERAMRREIADEAGLRPQELALFCENGIDIVFVRTSGIPTVVFRFVAWCKNKNDVRTNEESTGHA